MPLSTLNQSGGHSTQQSSSSQVNGNNNNNGQQLVVNNQNLLHVKFHVNKFQDNLLSKRLQQLNVEEMKLRLKHQRTSNELVVFLKECQQSTGYLSKMKQIDNSSGSHNQAWVIQIDQFKFGSVFAFALAIIILNALH